MLVTNKVVDEIMQAPKCITQPIQWRTNPDHDGLVEFEVPIDIDYPGKLTMLGNMNTRLGRFSFIILYNKVRIKALDIGKTHKSYCDIHGPIKVGEKHKHSWQDCCRDRYAYEPNDITTGGNIHTIFKEFLRECDISFNGSLPSLPVRQAELWEDELFGT